MTASDGVCSAMSAAQYIHMQPPDTYRISAHDTPPSPSGSCRVAISGTAGRPLATPRRYERPTGKPPLPPRGRANIRSPPPPRGGGTREVLFQASAVAAGHAVHAERTSSRLAWQDLGSAALLTAGRWLHTPLYLAQRPGRGGGGGGGRGRVDEDIPHSALHALHAHPSAAPWAARAEARALSRMQEEAAGPSSHSDGWAQTGPPCRFPQRGERERVHLWRLNRYIVCPHAAREGPWLERIRKEAADGPPYRSARQERGPDK